MQSLAVKKRAKTNGLVIPDDPKKSIILKGVRVHNLKNINLIIPKNKLVVFTGVSGSGKSSIVFDTIYAEGQRRYVESLSSYARQFLERMNKPDVDSISGLAPSMAIEQKTKTRNPRSTIGTSTEIYDYLRLLFARIGRTFSPVSGIEVKKDSPASIVKSLSDLFSNVSPRLIIYYEFKYHTIDSVKMKLPDLRSKGFYRVIVNDKILDLNDYSDDDILNALNKKRKKGFFGIVIDRFRYDANDQEVISRLHDSIEMAYRESEGYVSIRDMDGGTEDLHFNHFLEADGMKFIEPEPRMFSFNNPFGACEKCQGFGNTMDIDFNLVIPDKTRSLINAAIAPFTTPKHAKHLSDLLREAHEFNVDVHKPYKNLTPEELNFVMNGGKHYIGLKKFFRMIEKEAVYKIHYRILLNRYKAYTMCSVCKGSRLRKDALYIKIKGNSIFDIVRLNIGEAYKFFLELELTKTELAISGRILEEIISRLKYLNEVGLDYLTLDRLSNSLSGGESQRINLSTSLGSSLVGSIYVLDEPSIGLHPRDNKRLINIMNSLRDLGNSVLVVEHDSDMMEASDYIFDIGPNAGENGGEIVFSGEYDKLKKDSSSKTGKYLSRKLRIDVPGVRRKIDNKSGYLFIKGARENNLKSIDVKIPVKKLVCITGVSGSGKSTLINDVLYGGLKKLIDGYYNEKIGDHDRIEGFKVFDSVELVDQDPIGRSARSNPVTYIKAFDAIRDAFAQTNDARKMGFSTGYFSFNIPGGRCETCEGTGTIRVEMQFMADISLECEVCKGKRYKTDALAVRLKGNNGISKNINDVLNMTVTEAINFFKSHPKVINKLKVLEDVGLGYIRLGQSGSTLSGGESQRVKLAYHLTFREKGSNSLFIFDEPTTGLHFHDISKLLKCFNELINKGHSVIVIEHNLDVIKCADWIIDLGPESGDKGGEIVACGTPEDVAKVKNSYTGNFLKKVLK